MTMREDRVPYPRDGRLWDETITGRQRAGRRDFLLMLGIDPARVPDGARIEHDATTDEYRLQVINPGGYLVWVRRVLRPPEFGGIVMGGRVAAAVLPELAGAIAPSLRQLRDAYAVPFHRGGRIGGETEPAEFDRQSWQDHLDQLRAQVADSTGVPDPMRVFPPDRSVATYGVTITDDPVRPGGYDPAFAAAAIDYMRARGA